MVVRPPPAPAPPAPAPSAQAPHAKPLSARIELVLPPGQADALTCLPGITAQPPFPVSIAWHDTPDGALAAAGLSLTLSGQRWSLEAIHAANHLLPSPPLRQEDRRELLGSDVPAATAPYATLAGSRRHLDWDGGVVLTLLQGRIPGDRGPGLCRVWLEGPQASLHSLGSTLAATLRAEVPRASLAADVLTRTGRIAPPVSLQACTVHPGQDVAGAMAHLLQQLCATMLHWADRVPARTGPEPVHQMRVVLRRLRSALSVFHRATPCPTLTTLAAPAKDLAAQLGAARDWDVFLDGTGAVMAAAFSDDPRSRALLRAARRARDAAYVNLCAMLDGPGFRTFALTLAATAGLRSWTDDPALHTPIDVFAAQALARRMRHVRHAGRGIAALSVPALHELRKDCKRLRYTAEFFAPLFPQHPVRRFTRRLAAIQEELGLFNDGAAVAGLLSQLGRYERGYAAGLATGLSTAATGPARTRIEARWHRFRTVDPFWAR